MGGLDSTLQNIVWTSLHFATGAALLWVARETYEVIVILWFRHVDQGQGQGQDQEEMGFTDYDLDGEVNAYRPVVQNQPGQRGRRRIPITAEIEKPLREAIRINHFLHYEKEIPIWINVDYPIENIRVTPVTTLFMLQEILHTPYKKVNAIKQDLAMFIKNQLRAGSPHPVTVNILEQPYAIEVSKSHEDISRLSWSERPEAGKMQAILGYHYAGNEKIPIEIDMFGKSAPAVNGLFVGMQGSGKTVAMTICLAYLMESMSPETLEIHGIDLAGGQLLSEFRDLPFIRGIADDEETAAGTLARFYEYSKGVGYDPDVYRVLVVDEAQQIMRDPDMQETIGNIMGQGRKFNVRVLLATQHPSKEDMPEKCKSLCEFKIVGHIAHERYASHELKIPGAASLAKGKADLIISQGGHNRRFVAFWFDDEATREVIGRLDCYERPTDVEIAFSRDREAFAAIAPRDNRIEQDAAKIEYLMLDHFDYKTGKPKYGSAKIFIEEIFGEARENTGRNYARMMDAINFLLERPRGTARLGGTEWVLSSNSDM